MKANSWQATHGAVSSVPQVTLDSIDRGANAAGDWLWSGNGIKLLGVLWRCSKVDRLRKLVLDRVCGTCR